MEGGLSKNRAPENITLNSMIIGLRSNSLSTANISTQTLLLSLHKKKKLKISL